MDVWDRVKPGTLVVWTNGPGDTAKFPQTPLRSKRTSWDKDEWHHGAYVYDGAQWRLYIDGKLEDSFDRDGEIEILAGRNLGIGAAGGASRFYKGVIDEVYYYSGYQANSRNQIR